MTINSTYRRSETYSFQKCGLMGGEGVICENDKPFALVVPSEFFEVCGCELRII